jgi:hypothetical protein
MDQVKYSNQVPTDYIMDLAVLFYIIEECIKARTVGNTYIMSLRTAKRLPGCLG